MYIARPRILYQCHGISACIIVVLSMLLLATNQARSYPQQSLEQKPRIRIGEVPSPTFVQHSPLHGGQLGGRLAGTTNKRKNRDFMNAFLPSIYVIIISELGDKTFFIAAIMSARNSRLVVYSGAMLALFTMTVLSAFFGVFALLIPRNITHYASGALFLLFGAKMLKDAYSMSADDVKQEYEEVQNELAKRDASSAAGGDAVVGPPPPLPLDSDAPPPPYSSIRMPPSHSDSATPTLTAAATTSSVSASTVSYSQRLHNLVSVFCSKVFLDAFVLTFFAEWGDRSQITTIVLAATKNVFGVIVGGVMGHAFCTGLAVLAGRIISHKVPVKWITLFGGFTFILFALHIFVTKPEAIKV